jgi:hypothetical protein
MGLTNFSAILEFAIRAEESGLRFIEEARAKAVDPEREVLGRCRGEAEKTLKMLREILRENVTEVVMEPCEPLDEAAYAPEIREDDASGTVRRILERQRAFLLDAATAVNLRDVKRALERLARAKDGLLGRMAGSGG